MAWKNGYKANVSAKCRSEFLIDKVDERILKYLNNNCLNFDWKNHILLIILIEIARNKDVRTYQTDYRELKPTI